jgi:Tol biopolymer transport system component
VIFLTSRSGLQTPWSVPVAGGVARQLTSTYVASVLSLDVSPDSRSLVFSTLDGPERRKLVLCGLPTCTDVRTLSLPFGGAGRIRWMAGGSAVAFLDQSGTNVWMQPLSGGEPSQVTDFDDGQTITDFAWSRAGRLAVARASTSSDIVLFKGLKR